MTPLRAVTAPVAPALTVALVSSPTIDAVAILAFALLVVGVVGAIVPGVPAGLASLAGVVLYWWGSGFTEPGTALLVALVAVGVLAIAADWFAGAVAARVGGASTPTAVLAGLVGLALLLPAGPIGMLLGSAATVFVLEYRRRRDARAGALAAGAYVVGFFASAAVQALLTLSMLVAMVFVAL